MSDDFSGFSPTDDLPFDWWSSIEKLTIAIAQSSVRLGSALLSGALAISASSMVGQNDGYAALTLAGSGMFALWFIVSAVRLAGRGRG